MTDLSAWMGREREEEDVIDLFPARGMRALLDRDPGAAREGSPLPPGWHWLYFKPLTRRSELGDDGHARRGSFLPPVPLARRMWAGGSLTFTGELRIGERVRRLSTIQSIEEKAGRSGRLVFVTVRHRISTGRGLAVDEAQHLVYRGPGPAAAGGAARTSPRATPPAAWSEPFTADSVTLLRFSALTFNSHRIHYDHPYATGVEGYADLVVHGPLLALLLLDGALRRGERVPAHFAYRAESPVFAGEALRIEGLEPLPAGSAGESELWVAGPRAVAMRATAGWEARG